MDRVVFSRKSDEWSTPRDLFRSLDEEFQFVLDAAATGTNAKTSVWLGPGSPWYENALDARPWPGIGPVWLNPPYSKCKEFVYKAASECMLNKRLVVLLLPSRTDTRWFHDAIWDRDNNCPYMDEGYHVEIRFLKGRLKFGDSKNSAPFPSMVVVMRPV